VLAVDTAHGHSQNVLDTVRDIKASYRDVRDSLPQNVGTEEGAARPPREGGRRRRESRMGVGLDLHHTQSSPASVMPQLTAVLGAVKGVAGTDVPIIADGGVRYFR